MKKESSREVTLRQGVKNIEFLTVFGAAEKIKAKV